VKVKEMQFKNKKRAKVFKKNRRLLNFLQNGEFIEVP